MSYSDLLAGLDSLHNKEESFSTSKSLKTSSKSSINLTTGTINNNNDYIISFDKYVKFKVQNEKKFIFYVFFESSNIFINRKTKNIRLESIPKKRIR